MFRSLLLAALLAPAAAAGEDLPPFPRFGLSASAGVPDGAVVSGLFRPIEPVRLSGGLAWNYFGWGIQGGVTVAPFRWAVSPTVGLEVGRFFASDMTWVADQDAGVPAEVRPLLERVGYGYASAHAGIEVGSARRLAFFLHAGLSYLWTTADGTATATTTDGSGQTVTVRITDPEFRATLPSLKAGVLLYF